MTRINIKARVTSTGITINANGENFPLKYPKAIWQAFPKHDKKLFLDNAATLLTMSLPFISPVKEITFNTPPPVFRPFYYNVIVDSIPASVEDYDLPSLEVIKNFLNIPYHYQEKEMKLPRYKKPFTKNKAVVTLSCGKDSLLSLAVAQEIGLDPIALYINDTVSPSENKLKLAFNKKIEKDLGIKVEVATNTIENLNDFEKWGGEATSLGYMHMVTGFCLVALPIAYKYKARHIIVGNQQDMNFTLVNKDGIITYPSADQTVRWRSYQDGLLRLFSSNNVRVYSLIEPLTNIAIVRVLANRYPEFAKYWVSCDSLDASDEKRWCQECSKCARLSLFMRSFGHDPADYGIKRNMFRKKDEKYYCLFKGKKVDTDEASKEAWNQQLLGFLMAYQQGATGYLIDKFKVKYLRQARSKEKKLRNFFFKLHPTVMDPTLYRKVANIYKTELKKYL